MRLRSTAFLLSLSVALGALVSGVLTSAAPAKTLDTQAISRQLESAVQRGDTPGVTALVVDRDGVIYEGAAGKLDVGKNIPMPVNAIFNIASMTKPVTSVAIMMLLEQGKLKLDDPVSST